MFLSVEKQSWKNNAYPTAAMYLTLVYSSNTCIEKLVVFAYTNEIKLTVRTHKYHIHSTCKKENYKKKTSRQLVDLIKDSKLGVRLTNFNINHDSRERLFLQCFAYAISTTEQ